MLSYQPFMYDSEAPAILEKDSNVPVLMNCVPYPPNPDHPLFWKCPKSRMAMLSTLQ